MSLSEYQVKNAQALYDIKCYMYKETFPCVMPLLGNLAGVIDTLHFIGYVVVGQHPVLCPLYCSPLGLENIQQHIRLSTYLETRRIHAPALEVECTEVPLYTIDRHISLASLDLPAKWTRQGQDKKIHIIYNGVVDLANFRTIVHWADYPLGYNMPVFNFRGIPDMLEVHSTVSVNDHSFFNGWPLSDVNMASEGDGSFSAYSHHGAPYPTHSAPYIAHSAPHPAPAASQTLVNNAHDASGQVVPQQPAVNLKQIMIEYPKWRLVLAYLRLLFRVAICTGNSVVNPHEITTSDADMRSNLIATLFSQSLKRANTLEEDLGNVVLNGLTITREAMLVMAIKWISQFIYDTAQVADWAITHHEAGFGLHDIFGPVLQAKLEMLLENFLHPKSNHLLINQNGLVWFFHSKFSKTLAWHVVFRKTRSKGALAHSTPHVPLVVADLEPDLFKNAPHLPEATLAYVASSCYGALLQELDIVMINNHGSSYDPSCYPSPTTVHTNALEMLRMLLQLDDDPGYLEFMDIMCPFCNLVVRDVTRVCWSKFSLPKSHLTNVFLGIERTEDALASWLQTHRPNILPDSVFITASVLFGLVDSHDLMSLLEMILGEVVKQMQLQQEDSCIQFLKQGGRCFMEEMMYHAQMEVSLYSKAIANLCEELDARNQPASGCLHPNLVLASVNTIGSTEASSCTLNFCPFQPLNDIQDKSYKKCQAWLLKSNIQDTAEVSFDVSQTPPDSPRLHEYLLRHDDNSSPLPRLMKAWVDNVIYCSYMNLKKQRTQIKVDMLYDAIVHIAELDAIDDDGTSSGMAGTFESRLPDDWEKLFLTSPVLVFMSWPQKVGPKVLAINLDMSAIIAKKLIPDTIWSAIAIMDIAFCGPIRFTDLMTSPRVEPTEVKKSVFESIPLNQIAGLVNRLLSVGALHPAIAILTRLPLPESALCHFALLSTTPMDFIGLHESRDTLFVTKITRLGSQLLSTISEDRALDVIALAHDDEECPVLWTLSRQDYSKYMLAADCHRTRRSSASFHLAKQDRYNLKSVHDKSICLREVSLVLASATIEHCIQSRCLLSPTGMDSDFCAQLIEVMHMQGTPGFPTLVLLGDYVKVVVSSCSEYTRTMNLTESCRKE
ncbi:hypothetical protein BDR06DRAFT_976913 [Suillus hirtellus]|nr:hypothetical protein BDR06DRAFT_976913 [Suillus hirtellus]